MQTLIVAGSYVMQAGAASILQAGAVIVAAARDVVPTVAEIAGATAFAAAQAAVQIGVSAVA